MARRSAVADVANERDRQVGHLGQQSVEAGLQVTEGGPDLRLAVQVEVDRALLRLVKEARPVGLHHDPAVGTPQPFRGAYGLVLGPGPAPADLRDAVAAEQVGAEPGSVQPPSGWAAR